MKPMALQPQSTSRTRSRRTSQWLSQPENVGWLLALGLALAAFTLAGCQVGEFSVTLETEPTQPNLTEVSMLPGTPPADPTMSLPGEDSASASSAAAGCVNRAEFVADLTVPDGTQVNPGEVFLKTWRLRNIGTCTWDSSYTLFFAGGHRLEAVDAQPLPWVVAPGEIVDLTVTMTAPVLDGNYLGEWMLLDPEGRSFGIGSDGLTPFWVSILVGAGSEPGKATPVSDTPAAGICSQAEGEVVTMTIRPDVPDPRCLSVTSTQRLRVVNSRGEPITVTLFTQTASIAVGGEYTFTATFGDLLLPGVHNLEVSPCCGGSIWLQAP